MKPDFACYQRSQGCELGLLGSTMHSISVSRVCIDTSVLSETDQLAFWPAHMGGAKLIKREPGRFHFRGNSLDLGEVQATSVDVDPFIDIRDAATVKAAGIDAIELVLLVEGAMTFEANGLSVRLTAPASFVRDTSDTSTVTATRSRVIIIQFHRSFIEEAAGFLKFQGVLTPVPELAFLTRVAIEMIEFFPAAAASSAPLYATMLRDLAANILRRAGVCQRDSRPSLLLAAKAYVAAQPPGTLSVSAAAAALGVSRSVLYRVFEHEGGVLAYDRMRRLRALYRAMCNPLNTMSLADLGECYGFTDPTTLSRSFRKAFGLPPSKLRQQFAHSAPSRARVAFDQAQDGLIA